MECKYGCGLGGWCLKVVKGGHGVGLWMFIRLGWVPFSRFLSFLAGKGTCVCFWVDWWGGDGPLKDVFPVLYEIAQDKRLLWWIIWFG